MSRTILITGATGGFGRAIAARFAGLGDRLVLAGRTRQRLEALADELPGVPVHLLAFDIRDRAAVEAAVAGLPPDFAALDVLINNAGLALGAGPAQSASLDDWERMIDTNNRGVVVMTRLMLPGMIARGRGHIITIGSVAGNWPYPGGHVYCATKAFVKQFSLALRADLQGTGVRVTNIEPGMVAGTDFSVVRYGGDLEQAAKVYANTRPLMPADVAESVVWCAGLPQHVNINRIELMATDQAFNGFAIHRTPQ
ncbi:MAG: SDR family NAD(P)-dependent oxidoreductase [Rhodospirillaceae bacterium]